MSSNIKLQRFCKHCGKEFIARTTVTNYCSHECNSKAYKAKKRDNKVEKSNKETLLIKTKPIEEVKAKDFLTVNDVAILLSSSKRTIYRLIENNTLQALNLSERKTLIRRSDIDRLFEQPQPLITPKVNVQYSISECYTISEILTKYKVSDAALNRIIKRNNISKLKKGKFTCVPKVIIDNLLN